MNLFLVNLVISGSIALISTFLVMLDGGAALTCFMQFILTFGLGFLLCTLIDWWRS